MQLQEQGYYTIITIISRLLSPNTKTITSRSFIIFFTHFNWVIHVIIYGHRDPHVGIIFKIIRLYLVACNCDVTLTLTVFLYGVTFESLLKFKSFTKRQKTKSFICIGGRRQNDFLVYIPRKSGIHR